MADICETCRFFDLTSGREIGECSRFPPQIVSALVEGDPPPDLDDVFFASLFPVVLAASSCGEYRRAESGSGVPITRKPTPGRLVDVQMGELPPVLQRMLRPRAGGAS